MAKSNTKSKSRLSSLSQIVREIDSAADLDSALQVLVHRTRELMGADVCSAYFTDEARRRHVAAATDGLSSRIVGNVQFEFGKGLIGQVAETRQPVNLDRVPLELEQSFLLQTGAELYQGFLGVPVIHKAQVQGVLLVRQRQARRFDDEDEAFLTTLATQLGSAIAYAKANGEWCHMCRPGESLPQLINGLAGAPGLAIGQGVAVFDSEDIDDIPDRSVEDTRAEEIRLRAAIQSVRTEIAGLSNKLKGALAEADRALFDAYLLMLDSPEILETAVSLVREGSWAPGAVRQIIESYAIRFESMDDPYLRERAADIRALGRRILVRLLGAARTPIQPEENVVLVGQQVSAIDVGKIPIGRLSAIVSGHGSPFSHAAILARTLGIPAVMGVSDLPLSQLDGQELVVDGNTGQIHLHTNSAMRDTFVARIENQRKQASTLESVRGLEAVTMDGAKFTLSINCGLRTDLKLAVAAGSSGIGLFRSELAFMLFNRFPSELEQLDLYRQALETMAPLPVTLRTLDAGDDKPLPYLPETGLNPAMGLRGIRFSLDHPEIFLTQLRAALRADIGIGNLRLLLPMISDVDELEQALGWLDQAVQRLVAEGFPVSSPPIGVMIEVPAAVYQAEALARRTDFLSVGSNDLAQYLLAADRNNPRVSRHLDPAHPSLLQALHQIVESAHKAGKPVTVCGEIAGDPAMGLLLLGMNFDGLSMSPAALSRVKWAVRHTTLDEMRSLAAQALSTGRPERIRKLLQTALTDIGLEPLVSESIPAISPVATAVPQ